MHFKRKKSQTKKLIGWTTPKKVHFEPVPENVTVRRRKRIKYCKKTKGEHHFIEKERHPDLFNTKESWISLECLGCSKKSFKILKVT